MGPSTPPLNDGNTCGIIQGEREEASNSPPADTKPRDSMKSDRLEVVDQPEELSTTYCRNTMETGISFLVSFTTLPPNSTFSPGA